MRIYGLTVSNKNIFKIHKLTSVVGGVVVTLQDKEGKIFNITTEFGREVVDVRRFEKWMELSILKMPIN